MKGSDGNFLYRFVICLPFYEMIKLSSSVNILKVLPESHSDLNVINCFYIYQI